MKKHGMHNTRFYYIWQNMKARCSNKNREDYKWYGARGIQVCKEWQDSFVNFMHDMYDGYLKHCEEYGEKDTKIERLDIDNNYCKENCIWATQKEQRASQKDGGNKRFWFVGKHKKTGEIIKSNCMGELKRTHGFNHSNISSCISGRLGSAYGYVWSRM